MPKVTTEELADYFSRIEASMGGSLPPQKALDEIPPDHALRLLRFVGSHAAEFDLSSFFSTEIAEADAVEKLKQLIMLYPAGRQRRKLLHKMRRWTVADEARYRAEIAAIDGRLAHLKGAVDSFDELAAWLGAALALQKPPVPKLHHFQQALRDGKVFYLRAADAAVSAADVGDWTALASSASLYMVEHDWGAAFANAKDYAGGEIKMPDDVCAFEFRISGRHVIAFATEVDGTLYVQHALEVDRGWFLLGLNAADDQLEPLVALTTAQIRAIAIALDAEVASTEIVRAPHKLNHARERAGKLPINSYHVVSLARRARAPAIESDRSEPAHHKRLHFRRGHWRHFDNHKTWIKWMLVGDPELGFVDKHYRL